MIHSPFGQDFQWLYSNVTGVRQAAAFGTILTAGAAANTMGNWTVLATPANLVNDVYGIYINFNSGFTSAVIRNQLVDIGVDNAGGTNYQVKIPFLMAGYASQFSPFGGINYYFPLYIPSGSQVAARVQSTVANSTMRIWFKMFGQPRRPDAVRVGSKVISLGEDTATSSGTNITVGTTAIGNYTQVGVTTDRSYWWWQQGYSARDTTFQTASSYTFDLAAGSSTTVNKLLRQDITFFTTTTEQIFGQLPLIGAYNNVAAGENIYIRGQSSGNPDTQTNVMAWGLGG